jgi:uncharacterized membrane protein
MFVTPFGRIRVLVILVCLLVVITPNLCLAGDIVDFQKDIAPLLVSRCLECHKGEEAKNGFRVDDRKQVLDYTQNNLLWDEYLNQPSKATSPDSQVMPPDGPLSVAELGMFKLWLDEGAKWPEGIDLLKSETQTAALPTSAWTRFYLAIGYFHPAIIHFPIALLSLAGVCAFLSYFLGKRCESITFHLLWIGVFSSFFTVIMGWAFADVQGYPSWTKSLAADASHAEMTFYGHRWLGSGVFVVGMIVFGIAIAFLRKPTKLLNHLWRIGTMGLALLVGIVGHQGGELKYGDIFEKAWKQWKGE